ncbi:MAG TPA: DUF1800 domain-containing protein [Vicinamibacterales bacterium]|nr:DUF1800 domain-containing protein [Vicinamibacterales bacterium]
MARGRTGIEHLLRRAGFGASPDDLASFKDLSSSGVLEYLLNFSEQPDDVDSKIGNPAYVSVFARAGGFAPNTNIEDARQRWLFRMVHTRRPLQEKMALFWHNHFATAYSKIAGIVGGPQATKMMALKVGALPGPRGQIELFREHGMGKFRDLLVEVAKDPAMLFWLDGRLNTRLRPQENFGREVMELFTFGIGNYDEQDVYAAARVFTGWNVRLVNRGDETQSYYEFVYNANQHDATAKTFTFPVSNGSTTISARAAADGMQDGIDFLTALARHPQTARRLARKMWNFFVSEVVPPDEETINSAASVYLLNDTSIESMVQHMLRSRQFQNPGNWHTRYSWPVEYVARAIKEVGWAGFSIDNARNPLTAMGQQLFEPPDVNGWELGKGWFSTGAMLTRMNFAATLAFNQRFNMARAAVEAKTSPESLLDFFLDRLSPAPYEEAPLGDLVAYLNDGVTWSGTDAQLQSKGAGLTRLIVGSSEYQFV